MRSEGGFGASDPRGPPPLRWGCEYQAVPAQVPTYERTNCQPLSSPMNECLRASKDKNRPEDQSGRGMGQYPAAVRIPMARSHDPCLAPSASVECSGCVALLTRWQAKDSLEEGLHPPCGACKRGVLVPYSPLTPPTPDPDSPLVALETRARTHPC